MARPPSLPSRPPLGAARTPAVSPRPATAAAPLPRTPVLQHGRTPRQLSFAFYRG